VTKLADTNDGSCDADCSLCEAVIAANANPGADDIALPAGNYVLTIGGVGEDTGATGDLDLTDDGHSRVWARITPASMATARTG
jgi:CSLREA domain-containing protein